MPDKRLERIILEQVDEDGMFVGFYLRLNACRRYLEEHPNPNGRVGKKALELLGLKGEEKNVSSSSK